MVQHDVLAILSASLENIYIIYKLILLSLLQGISVAASPVLAECDVESSIEFRVRDFEFRVRKLEFRVRDFQFRVREFEFRI